MTDGNKLDREFYLCNALELSEKLLGKTLVHTVDGVNIGGVITETEAYMGVIDKASHAYGGRRTARTETMFMCGGYSYVYLIYGMYCCMNITANFEGNPEAVLIRSVVPIYGKEKLYELVKHGSKRRQLPDKFCDLSEKEKLNLSNGPGKLCIAMGLNRKHNCIDLVKSDELFVQDDGIRVEDIARKKRVGIDYAEEAAEYPWRFIANSLIFG